MDVFKLLSSHRWWAVPLDKALLRRSQVLTVPENIEQAYNVEDSINMIVGILILILEEGVFPQFSHELTLDLKVDIAPDF
ncbi:hypothetical protein Tco_0947373 [Tanacetum coccineum]